MSMTTMMMMVMMITVRMTRMMMMMMTRMMMILRRSYNRLAQGKLRVPRLPLKASVFVVVPRNKRN